MHKSRKKLTLQQQAQLDDLVKLLCPEQYQTYIKYMKESYPENKKKQQNNKNPLTQNTNKSINAVNSEAKQQDNKQEKRTPETFLRMCYYMLKLSLYGKQQQTQNHKKEGINFDTLRICLQMYRKTYIGQNKKKIYYTEIVNEKLQSQATQQVKRIQKRCRQVDRFFLNYLRFNMDQKLYDSKQKIQSIYLNPLFQILASLQKQFPSDSGHNNDIHQNRLEIKMTQFIYLQLIGLYLKQAHYKTSEQKKNANMIQKDKNENSQNETKNKNLSGTQTNQGQGNVSTTLKISKQSQMVLIQTKVVSAQTKAASNISKGKIQTKGMNQQTQNTSYFDFSLQMKKIGQLSSFFKEQSQRKDPSKSILDRQKLKQKIFNFKYGVFATKTKNDKSYFHKFERRIQNVEVWNYYERRKQNQKTIRTFITGYEDLKLKLSNPQRKNILPVEQQQERQNI